VRDGAAIIDDVREAVPLLMEFGIMLFGTMPLPLAEAGIIRADGLVNCRLPGAHDREVTEWLLVDRAAARRWLRTHPDLPDDALFPLPEDRFLSADRHQARRR
jgi:hypothetical protein